METALYLIAFAILWHSWLNAPPELPVVHGGSVTTALLLAGVATLGLIAVIKGG